jgi:uncharacterized membrane protein
MDIFSAFLLVCILLATLSMAIYAVVRVKELERQIKDLQRRSNVAPPPTPYAAPVHTVPPQALQQPGYPPQPSGAPQTYTPRTLEEAFPFQASPAPRAPQQAFATQDAPYAQQMTPPQMQQAFAPHDAPVNKETRSTSSFETVFGKNIIGIVAAGLVFLGLIFLSFLVVPALSDAIKILLMFVLSAALIATGAVLDRRYANNFTKAVLGTGCGACFIAIQVTHLYFNAINDIVAFALLLVWIAATLLLARQSQSTLVGVIAHAGMIFSICAGYGLGMSESRVMLLVVYQVAATVLIVVGTLWCSKQLYKFSVFASLSLSVYASGFMWKYFFETDAFLAYGAPLEFMTTAFIVQFVGSSSLAFLLTRSIIKLENSDNRAPLQIVTMALWQAALILDISLLVGKLYQAMQHSATFVYYDAVPLSLAITLAIMYALVFLTMFARKRLGFAQDIEVTTNVFLVVSSAVLLLVHLTMHSVSRETEPSLLLFIIPVLVCIAARLLSKLPAYNLCAAMLLVLDALYMCVNGYKELVNFGGITLPLVYFAVLLALLYTTFRQLDAEERLRLKPGFRIMALIVFELSLASILLGTNLELAFDWALLEVVILVVLLVLCLLKEDTPRGFFKANEYLLFFIVCAEFALHRSATSDALTTGLHVAALACALILVALRIRSAAQEHVRALEPGAANPFNSDSEALSALALHALILSGMYGLTDWLEQAYVLSLTSMVIALALILLGFWSRIRSLRVYGLVVVILSVLKLVAFDLAELDTVMRVVTFIGGGVICFGISALYNFAVKRFAASDSATQTAPALESQPQEHTRAPEEVPRPSLNKEE